MLLPLGGRAQADDVFFVGVAGGEDLGRRGGIPQALLAAFLALVHQPVVVAFEDDVAFKAVQGGGPDAAVEFQVFFDHALAGHLGLHRIGVAGLFQLLAGHGRKDALVAQGQQILVDTDILVADGLAQRGMVAGSAAGLAQVRLVEVEHAFFKVLAQELADAAHDFFRLAHQFFVAHIQPQAFFAQGLAPFLDGVPAALPGLGGAIDVGGTKGGFHVVHAGITAVPGDVDELGIGEVVVHGPHEVEVVRRLFAPAGLVHILGKAQVHARVQAGEAALGGQLDDFVDDGAGVDLHPPERRLEAKDHLLGQGAEVGFDGQVAVGVQVGIEAGVVPHHFRDGDAGVAAQQGHDQGRAGTFGTDHENGTFLKVERHGCLLVGICAIRPAKAHGRR